MRTNLLACDLDHIINHTYGLWNELRNKRIFITGGTGFVGSWLLESFLWANDLFGLDASVLVLTRDIDSFRKKAPHIACSSSIDFINGDIRDFFYPEGDFSHIIHGATTSAVATFNNEDSLVKFDTIVEGTRRLLEFAKRCGTQKLLLLSSGAVYGKQPNDLAHISEAYSGAPSTNRTDSALGEGKRVAEFLCTYYSEKFGIEIKMARMFSFVGPNLPLDIHYAIGNFIRDGLRGGPILVKGNGTPLRSYLYVADLTIWLWTILFKGESCIPYNVGSEEAISIKSLAYKVAMCLKSPVTVEIIGNYSQDKRNEKYIPSTERAQKHLGLRQWIGLDEGIMRTLSFYLQQIDK